MDSNSGSRPFSLDPSKPFTTAMALAAGITAGTLRGPKYRQLFKGVHVDAARPLSPLLMAEGALVLQPAHAFASHFTAARILELPVPAHPDEHVSVRTDRDRRRRKGIACHVAAADARVITHQGVRLSPPDQVFIELASMLPLVDLVVVGDMIARREWVTPDELVAACRSSKDKYAKRALEAAAYVRAGVDSPMETRVRMLIVLAGLPEPVVNFKIRDDYGTVLRRFDLSYPHLRLVIEYDGRQHAEDTIQYDHDISRREDLDDRGWRIVVVTAKGIYKNPEETLSRVHRKLKLCGAAGVPTRLSDGWRPHFPGYQGFQRSS